MKVSRHGGLEEARAHYLRAVDTMTGAVRLAHITDVPGQSATYEFKREDARRFLADGPSPDLANYPWIAAEAGALGASPEYAAQVIQAQANAWAQAGAALEGARMTAKYAIKAATSAREMDTALGVARTTMGAISAAVASSP